MTQHKASFFKVLFLIRFYFHARLNGRPSERNGQAQAIPSIIRLSIYCRITCHRKKLKHLNNIGIATFFVLKQRKYPKENSRNPDSYREITSHSFRILRFGNCTTPAERDKL